MRYTSLHYTLKVWLTSAAVAPIPFLADMLLRSKGGALSFLWSYPALVFMGLAFSGFTWLAFWGVTDVIIRTFANNLLRRLLASIAGIVLSLATFYLFLRFWDLPLKDNMSLAAIITGTACAAFGSWYFKMPSLTETHPNDSFI